MQRILLTVVMLLTEFVALPALAGDGYILIGYGPRQKALAGADVADQRDAMALSTNPAGIVGLEQQFQLGMGALIVDRGYYTTGFPLVVAPGNVWSERPVFPVPNGGFVAPIDAESAWSVVAYTNGGLNTSYSFGNFKPPFGGPLGGGYAGIDLQQGFMSIGYARRFGSLTIGLAPTIAVQMMNVQGIKTFAPYSSNMWALSDTGDNWSFGGGIRAGLEWRMTDQLRFGLAGSTPMFMTRLENYSGLFAGYGGFDVPAMLQAGFAYDVVPNLTVMANWRHVFYSGVASNGNPTSPLTLHSLGSGSGPGLGWQDVDAAAVAAEWRATEALTLRAGYHYSTPLIPSRSVTVNILAPVTPRHHITGGVNYAFTKNSSLDFSVMYVPMSTVTGPEAFPQLPGYPLGGVNPAATINPWSRGVEVTLGYNYKYDVGSASLMPSHF
jgi:long-chain fatty acid transport protein